MGACGGSRETPAPTEAPAAEVGAPVDLLLPSTLAPGASQGVCHLDDGALACFDLGDHCATRPPTGRYASVAAQGNTMCALRADGALSCWVDGEETETPVDHALQVAVGSHVCALTLEHTLRCWGSDYEGSIADVPDGRFRQVAVGHLHSCAIREDGTLACWGWGTSGQTVVPEGTFTYVASASQRNCAIRTSGEMVCWGEREREPPGRFTRVGLTNPYACALRDDGALVCWGYELDGFVEMEGGPYAEVVETCARTRAGEVRCLRAGGRMGADDGQSRYADASGACPRAPSAPAPSGPVVRRPFIDRAMAIVRAHDWDAIESGRDEVRAEDVPAFVEEYARLEPWEDKTYLVMLLQDQHDPRMQPIYRDILAVPDCGDDSCWIARASALAFFDGNFDSFGRYFDDHALCRRRIAERRAELNGP
ncbi:MAG: hypothetical protein KC619_16300 [Myxococcales bacterium]|nr:hypothetical protein [Myxococcales bacterium]